METGTSNSMERNFDWLDNFLEICEEIYPSRADGREVGGYASEAIDKLTCIYCGVRLSERTAVNDWEKRVGTAKQICRNCWERKVTDAGYCQVLVKETVRNLESLFGISTNLEWDVTKQRIHIEWEQKKGKREMIKMPWENFIKIKTVRKRTHRLVLKTDAPDGVVVAAVVYFLCIQYLTAENRYLNPQLQGLAEWFVVNYLRILDMDQFASQYERLWSAQKPENKKAGAKTEVKDGATYAAPYYDFWVQKMGAPTEKNTVTVNTAKSFIRNRQT